MELLCFSIIVNMLKYNRNHNIFMHELVILKIIYDFILSEYVKKEFAKKVIYKHMGR